MNKTPVGKKLLTDINHLGALFYSMLDRCGPGKKQGPLGGVPTKTVTMWSCFSMHYIRKQIMCLINKTINFARHLCLQGDGN